MATAPSLRTGAEYLRSLNDGRTVFVEGEKVKDVSKHKAFREAARSVGRLYDIAAEPANRELMTFTSPKTGGPVHRAYQIPRSHADLRQRHAARPRRVTHAARRQHGGLQCGGVDRRRDVALIQRAQLRQLQLRLQQRQRGAPVAQLRGIDRLLARNLSLPVVVAKDPQRAVIRGAGRCIDDLHRLRRIVVGEQRY